MRGSKELIRVPGGHSFRVLRWQKSLARVECVVGPAEAVPITGEGSHWHFHREMELTFFTQGEGTRFVGDSIAPFHAGDLVLLGENLPHYWHTRGNCAGVSVQWHFPASHPFWAFPENLPLTRLFQLADKGFRVNGPPHREVSRLMAELPGLAGHAQLAAFLTILSALAEGAGKEMESLSGRSFNLASESYHQKVISRAVQHLVANYRDVVRIEDLLDLTGMSRATFARQFKAHAGRTFSDFVNRLRLQAACRDLAETDRGILDIALASGFSQISFFNRVFRREFGCSPGEYRVRGRAKARKSPSSQAQG